MLDNCGNYSIITTSAMKKNIVFIELLVSIFKSSAIKMFILRQVLLVLNIKAVLTAVIIGSNDGLTLPDPAAAVGCPFIRHIFFIRIMNKFGLLFEYSNIYFTE
jgi:hypothetical protein